MDRNGLNPNKRKPSPAQAGESSNKIPRIAPEDGELKSLLHGSFIPTDKLKRLEYRFNGLKQEVATRGKVIDARNSQIHELKHLEDRFFGLKQEVATRGRLINTQNSQIHELKEQIRKSGGKSKYPGVHISTLQKTITDLQNQIKALTEANRSLVETNGQNGNGLTELIDQQAKLLLFGAKVVKEKGETATRLSKENEGLSQTVLDQGKTIEELNAEVSALSARIKDDATAKEEQAERTLQMIWGLQAEIADLKASAAQANGGGSTAIGK